MIFYATCAANQMDLVAKEAENCGAEEVKITSSGVEFVGELDTGYNFCINSRISSRLLLALYFDDDIISTDELYDATLQLPWEEWISPEKTFQITQTVQKCDWINNTHFAALKVKDAIVDRMKEKFEGQRSSVDIENPDITFHLHISGSSVVWYVDFSGEGLHKRGYRSMQTDAILKEHLASAVLYRSPWYKSVQDGNSLPFLDPFCGSGTLAVEAAMIAYDIAPGLIRQIPYAFEKLPNFDFDTFDKLIDIAIEKQDKATKEKKLQIQAWDIKRECIEISKAAALKAKVFDFIDFKVLDFTKVKAEDVFAKQGCIVTDPPYGIRLKEGNLYELYAKIGEIITEFFKGWKVSILCGDSELLSHIDMKPDRTNSIYNSNILCQLAHYYVYSEEEKDELIKRAIERKEKRLSEPLSPGAEMAYNRLIKNIKEIKPLMEKEGVTCYRIYDADMPEYSASIDIYEGKWIKLSEYAPPKTINEEDSLRRLGELIRATERATGIDMENIYVNQRTQQKGKSQYTKIRNSNKFYICKENDVRFLTNFQDYLDTGIFLDHRPVRKMIQEMSDKKRFLNLFCYTSTATLNAIKGGAISTTSVDASSTYLEWSQENLRLNGYPTEIENFFYKSDVVDFLWDTYDRYDLIFCDPPTFSNSKARNSFDIQRDHSRLIDAAMMHLEKKGVMIFSNNFRKFKMDEEVLEKYNVENITEQTIGKDFERDPKIHQCYLIKHKEKILIKRKLVTM